MIYQYNGLGQLTRKADAGNNIAKEYTYDTAGNRATMAVSGSEVYSTSYVYDANNRLLKESTPNGTSTEGFDYYYDKNGNQTGKASFVVAPPSEVPMGVAIATVGIENSSQEVSVEILDFDVMNQLISVKNEDGTHTYAYKPDGLRLSKIINGEKTTHIWDGSNIAMELDSSGNVIDKYVRGINLIRNDSNIYYVFNAHGDVVQTTDTAGIAEKEYDYDAFGVEIDPDDGDENPWRYCGEYFDSETDTIYLRARYYHPRTGRFITEDPIRDGLNWYTYCYNNPIMFIDPSGLSTNFDNRIQKYHGAPISVGEMVDLLGGTLVWDSATLTATVTIGGKTSSFQLDMSPVATRNPDAPYLGSDGRMYVDEMVFYAKMGIIAYKYTDGNISGLVVIVEDAAQNEAAALARVTIPIGNNDFIVRDLRNRSVDPAMEIRDCYKEQGESHRYAIIDILLYLEKVNPTKWARTRNSLEWEFEYHSGLSILPGSIGERGKDAMLNNAAE